MPLSISKLEKLLTGKGLIPKKFFVIDGLVIYMEVLDIRNADSFMLYIPSKYEFSISCDTSNVYKVKYMDINEDGCIPEDYGGEPDNFDIEKQYGEIEIDNSPVKNCRSDMAEYLEENYNHPVSLKNINKDDNRQLREVFRQLRRLKFCVQNLKYKLCIIFKDYLFCIRRDDTFEGFIINNLRGSPERKLMVSLDLETLYEKIESVSIDIKTVREGVYHILEKNQGKHIRNLQKMLEQKNSLTTFSDMVMKKKSQYIVYLNKLEELLNSLGKAEKKNIEKLLEIEERYRNEASLKGLHTDIEKTQQISKYETKLHEINVVKQDLIRNILIVKAKYEDLALKVDKICFDNTVMIDAIIKNFVVLGEL